MIIEAIFRTRKRSRPRSATSRFAPRPDAPIATNTSSLRSSDIAATFREPARLKGNRHPLQPGGEDAAGRGGRPRPPIRKIARKAVSASGVDKLPLGGMPGFLENAVLPPTCWNAMRCVDEGIPPEIWYGTGFRHAQGPIELE